MPRPATAACIVALAASYGYSQVADVQIPGEDAVVELSGKRRYPKMRLGQLDGTSITSVGLQGAVFCRRRRQTAQ